MHQATFVTSAKEQAATLFDIQGRGIIRPTNGNRAKVSVKPQQPKAPGQTKVRIVGCDASKPEPAIDTGSPQKGLPFFMEISEQQLSAIIRATAALARGTPARTIKGKGWQITALEIQSIIQNPTNDDHQPRHPQTTSQPQPPARTSRPPARQNHRP